MSALDTTGADLIRALAAAANGPAVRAAVRARADALAHTLAARGLAAEVRMLPNGDCEVVVTAPDLFAREFGSQGAAAEPVIEGVVAALAGGTP